jgi:hypothetical protein
MRLPEHDVLDFVSRHTVLVQNLLDKSIFPDHLMKVQVDSLAETGYRPRMGVSREFLGGCRVNALGEDSPASVSIL